MKKYIVSIIATLILLVGAPFLVSKVTATELNIKDFINLLITIGVITPDKIPAVNSYLASLENNNNNNNNNNETVLPSCTITSNRSSYRLKDKIVFSWKSKNATYATWKEDTSGKDRLSLSGDKLEANGSTNVIASVVGNPTVTLKVHNSSGSATCSKTITITNIVHPMATIQTSSQITATSPYIMGIASGVNQVGVVLANQGGKVYGSGLIPVINGSWSTTVTSILSLGDYTILVYDSNNNLLTSKSLSIVPTI